ncbi:hypothetical protein [Bradyrhizobium sp. 195]|uniref:hypothetical protein n=1 Tax=Bradyrhizobium sp. 195 TaxID=2782662 RepID=UPI002001A65C|nr:hypothetical protein [Bradyrhizobium sp. 195]
MQLRHLEEARRHVAQGERHIAEQEERIERLAMHGADLTGAKKLLENFYTTQMLHVRHRERILRELEK